MNVADVMTRGVELLEPDETVQQAAVQMAEYDVGAVLVGAGGKLQGVVLNKRKHYIPSWIYRRL